MMAGIEIYNQVVNSFQNLHISPIILLPVSFLFAIVAMLLGKAASPFFNDLFVRYRQRQEDSRKVKGIQQKLAFDVQKDLNLLSKFRNLPEGSKLSNKWGTCFTQNRSVWNDNSLQILLIQRSGDVIQFLQRFYEGLDDFENDYKELIEVQATIKNLEQGKSMIASSTLIKVKEMVSVSPNPEEEHIGVINMQKYIRMRLKDLKLNVPGLMEQGSYILESLKVN